MTEFEQNTGVTPEQESTFKLVPHSIRKLAKSQVKHCDEESQMFAH